MQMVSLVFYCFLCPTQSGYIGSLQRSQYQLCTLSGCFIQKPCLEMKLNYDGTLLLYEPWFLDQL